MKYRIEVPFIEMKSIKNDNYEGYLYKYQLFVFDKDRKLPIIITEPLHLLKNEHLQKYNFFIFHHQTFEPVLNNFYLVEVSKRAQIFKTLTIKDNDFNVRTQESNNKPYDAKKLIFRLNKEFKSNELFNQ